MEDRCLVSIVVPVFNEAGNLRPLYTAVRGEMEPLGLPYEILFINDGSRDDSMLILRQLARDDDRVKVVSLSRNFGHQPALSAGLEFARGDAVIVMDADLQHPPDLIPQMIAAWRAGHQVVYTIREDEKGRTGWFKRWTSAVFYKLLNAVSDVPITPGAADFRLMDRTVVDCLVSMPERSRFLRGMVSWVGFRQQGIPYRPHPRHSGKSKYPLGKMFGLALQGLTSFSSMPLRVSAYLGLAAALAGLPYAIWAVYAKLFTDLVVPGWASLLVAVLFLGGVQLMSIGVIGEYVGRIYIEVKRRPLYLAEELIGFDAFPPCPDRPGARFLPHWHVSHPAHAASKSAEVPHC